MRVVSDTSPISNLAIIGRLDFLRRLHGQIIIPPAVATELSLFTHERGRAAVEAALSDGWLLIERPEHPVTALPGLHPGESEAIALALGTADSMLLVDEAEARAAARRMGLKISGVVGVLIAARKHGWIESLRNELLKLRAEARFFISPKLVSEALAAVGETRS
jgi:uncharacterized protein